MDSGKDDLFGKEALARLYTLMHQGESRDEAIQEVLKIGTKYLGVDHGHLASIDEENPNREVVDSTDLQDGLFPEGLREIRKIPTASERLKIPEPQALHDAGNQGWVEDRAYQKHGFDTYFDDPVTIRQPVWDRMLRLTRIKGKSHQLQRDDLCRDRRPIGFPHFGTDASREILIITIPTKTKPKSQT